LRVTGEVCDDYDKNDGLGCKSDCSGSLPGWECSGGSELNPDFCMPICGDGIIVGAEACDD